MNNKLVLCAVAAAWLAAGCATGQTASASNESVSDREYPTGSSIPRKRAPSGDGSADREALDRARQQAPMDPRPGIPGSKPGG